MTVAELLGSFLKSVGDILAEVKRQEIADIDLELLRLKRTQLTEKFDEFKTQLAATVAKDKANNIQELVSRGLGNTTVGPSFNLAIEKNASEQMEKAARECNRAIEEIALMERKIKESNCPWWKRLFRFVRNSFPHGKSAAI